MKIGQLYKMLFLGEEVWICAHFLNFIEKDELGVFLDWNHTIPITALMFHLCMLRGVLISTKGNSLVGMNRAVIIKLYSNWVDFPGISPEDADILPLTCLKASKKAT